MSRHFRGQGKHRAQSRKLITITRVIYGFCTLFFVLLIADGIIGIQLKHQLQLVASSASSLKANLVSGDFQSARNDQQKLAKSAAEAHFLASTIPWTVSQWIPILGPNFAATADIADVSLILSKDVLSPGLTLFEQLQASPPISEDGRVDVAALASWEQPVSQISTGIKESVNTINHTSNAFLIPQISDAKQQILNLVQPVAEPLKSLQALFPLLPTSLGVDSTRNYLLVFQNPAEMRPQGGLPGSIALLKVENGKISLGEKSSAGIGIFGFYPQGVIPISPDREALFPYSNMVMANTTTTPSNSEAALKTSTFWQNAGKGTVDGVIFIDPRALSFVMSSTGPVTLSNGVTLDSSNVVSYLLNGIYFYSDDNSVQDALYAETVDQVFAKLTSGQFDFKSLSLALLQGMQEKRVTYWSHHEDEQKVFSKLALGIEPPTLTKDKAGVALFLEDNQGSKMDYYLSQSAQVSTGECLTGKQTVRVRYELKNNLPLELVGNLPNSIWATSSSYVQVPGGIRMNAYLYLPPQSKVERMSVDQIEVNPDMRKDGENQVIKTNLEIAPQQSRVVEVDFQLPTGNFRKIDFEMTPLTNPTVINSEQLKCNK